MAGSEIGSIKISLTVEMLLAQNIDECIQKRIAFIKSRAHVKKEYTDV